MTFQIPSHNNSTNERRERRANAKADARAAAPDKRTRINRIATALVALECVSKTETGYLVTMPRIGKYASTFAVENNICECGQAECEHKIAVELFAAKYEIEMEEFLNWCATSEVRPMPRLELSDEENARLDAKFDEEILGIAPANKNGVVTEVCGCRYNYNDKFKESYCEAHAEEETRGAVGYEIS